MDQATILKLLQNQGAPPTPENINRVMQQSGRGTELLGRSMGLQGGSGEEGPGMDLMLDKLVKSTDRAPIAGEALPFINPDSMSNGQAQNGAARGGAAKMPMPMRGMAANVEPAPGTVNTPSNVVNAGSGNARYGFDTPAAMNQEPQNLGSLEWLLSVLGLSAARKGTGAPPIPDTTAQLIGPSANVPRLPAPNPQIPDNSGEKFESGAPKIAADSISAEATVDEPKPIVAKKQSVKPEFSNHEMLVDALKNFRKMFR